MASILRSSDTVIYLVGTVKHQISGHKLPSNRQVLSVLFYNIREVKLTIRESANLVARECVIFWAKARIPTRALPHCTKKIIDLHSEWRNLQKSAHRRTNTHKERERKFVANLNNLFDVAHADALNMIKIEEDKLFLLHQREPGRRGYLGGVDRKLAAKEERARIRVIKEEEKKMKMKGDNSSQFLEITTASSDESIEVSDSDSNPIFTEPSTSSASISGCDATVDGRKANSEKEKKRGTKCFMTSKLVAVLDRCQLSQRDAVFVLEATAEALGHNVDEIALNRSSIQRYREQFRKKQAENIKYLFTEKNPTFVTVHWDGKLVPALNVRDSRTERLPIIITYENQEQLIGVPALPNSSGKEQSRAVWNAIKMWGLDEKVQILCCDTTASNTGRFSGAVTLLEQLAGREMLLFPCRHHMYELVLRSVFENELPQVAISPDVAFFKQLREKWNAMEKVNYEDGHEHLHETFSGVEIEEALIFFRKLLKEEHLKNDYRELIELCIMFLGATVDLNLKVRPPGALHHARWMAKGIYSLKMFLFRSQLSLSVSELDGLKNICLFVVKVYAKWWFMSSSAIGAPYNDLCFLKELKQYENVNARVSSSALKKFCQHLWYLNEEICMLSLFDDKVNNDTKTCMVRNLKRETLGTERRYTVLPGAVTKLLGKLFSHR